MGTDGIDNENALHFVDGIGLSWSTIHLAHAPEVYFAKWDSMFSCAGRSITPVSCRNMSSESFSESLVGKKSA